MVIVGYCGYGFLLALPGFTNLHIVLYRFLAFCEHFHKGHLRRHIFEPWFLRAMVRSSDFFSSDGCAVAVGDNKNGQCNIPPLDAGMSYTQVSAGYMHTVLLRSDGSAVACGLNNLGQCSIPLVEEGVAYTQVSAGGGSYGASPK